MVKSVSTSAMKKQVSEIDIHTKSQIHFNYADRKVDIKTTKIGEK